MSWPRDDSLVFQKTLYLGTKTFRTTGRHLSQEKATRNGSVLGLITRRMDPLYRVVHSIDELLKIDISILRDA